MHATGCHGIRRSARDVAMCISAVAATDAVRIYASARPKGWLCTLSAGHRAETTGSRNKHRPRGS